jgi:hypothetical protein
MHGLPLFYSVDPILWNDLQMAPAVELFVDGLSYGGFAWVLHDILEKFGVPREQIEYVCHGEPGPNGL